MYLLCGVLVATGQLAKDLTLLSQLGKTLQPLLQRRRHDLLLTFGLRILLKLGHILSDLVLVILIFITSCRLNRRRHVLYSI